ncbi:MAG: phosphatase PAP2 family protein [Bacteroidota bacterium]
MRKEEAIAKKVTYIPKLSEPLQEEVFDRFGKRSLSIAGVFILLYLAWVIMVLGFRTDHLYLVVMLGTAWFGTAGSRKFLLGLLPIVVYWLLYDSMRIYPNYLFNDVHIVEPYELEKALFGIQQGAEVLTPNEYWESKHTTGLDIMTALFYLCWVPVPLAYTVYLFLKGRDLLLPFTLTFLLVNILGIIIYYLYPAAPPWYVDQYGFEFVAETKGYAAGLLNFDAIIGVDLFRDMYDKNANVFAAIPSLHSAFPVILTYFGWKKGLRWGTLIFSIITVGIWFSAIYTNHHYIIDVLMGALCAFASIGLFELAAKQKPIKNWIERYTARIV